MSATGRGAVRASNDFYPTPAWCVHRLMERVRLPDGHWLEPAVGKGAIIDALTDDAHGPSVVWSAVDLAEDGPIRKYSQGDYLTMTEIHEWNFHVGITNPPYALAEAFARKMREHCKIVVLLLRLNFLESASRREWLHEDPPDVYVLPNRPSFRGNGKTDATAYGWFVWGQGGGRFEILANTPRSERR